ncbi:Alpha-protein kinase-like protein [Hapsidospora chrysogenum ATCC 11550]|uniref:Alpha-protein kinase-like protein n=1 Tax=Hapsidospora chrysogenum (strain ATCC 11550 / CBS 779.69 / DSM 880 / IAM 14645 / JCM 23072 / IMI 49137) TaxID=857340 RepID=A0A086SWW2_HAPC1|nr:Alpha-protein kinase-like protein [Hapsidospora chrysogenum ATCC 11550]
MDDPPPPYTPPSASAASVSRSSTRTAVEVEDDPRARIRELKAEAKEAGLAQPPRSTEGIFKKAYATDLLFLIDTTSSMAKHIAAAKDQVKAIMADIKRTYLDEAEVRIAVVGYKDHDDKPNIQMLDFTPSSDEVHDFLATLRAVGGGDAPEDVLGGIRQALDADWKNQTRCIIHIADAPPHGHIFSGSSKRRDDYDVPGSEPHGLTYEPLLQRMIGLRINYSLLSINGSTDRMAYLFMKKYAAASAEWVLLPGNKYYNHARSEKKHGFLTETGAAANSWDAAHGGLTFQEAKLGTTYSELRNLVVKSVTSSASRTAVRLTQSMSRTACKGSAAMDSPSHLAAIDEDEADAEERPITLEAVGPEWDTPGWLDETLHLEGFSPDVAHGVSTLNNMMDHDDSIRLRPIELTIRKRSRPFAQGAMRTASYARTASSDGRFVVKSFRQHRGARRLAHLAEDMRIQTLCKGFALEFNALTRDEHSIDFIVTACLRAGKAYTSLEPYIEGTYVKYNNNSGYVNHDIPAGDAEFNQAAQAFSHFTFERSCGHLLVCDLQGVGRVLTDPAIHTLDRNRFRLTDTNLNADGFKFFFSTHECGDICRELGLLSSAAKLKAGELTFRERWPSMDNTVVCSNKLCGRIVHVEGARRDDEFPGCYWCEACWPQLRRFTVKRICTAAGEGEEHEFEASAFYYESQGRPVPRQCPEHREGESPADRMAAVGGSFWNRLKSATKQKTVSGKSW